MGVDLTAKIPNNVDLGSDKTLQRALESWHPRFMKWWQSTIPSDLNQAEIYLRTAEGVGQGNWAKWGYVRMPEYRWGIFLAEPDPERSTIKFGDELGKPVWNTVPGELRSKLRTLIVNQADTEPGSVEQQRLLGHTAPSLYDLRSLLQVNVEEGRHLWAMAYLLHRFFQADGREEAEDLLKRRSGDADNPRILGAFNNPINDWLAFYCFTMFTDRDGKYQLAALAESGFDPLARTTQFMLTEEAHHLQVGKDGLARVVERTAQLMQEGTDPRRVGAIPLDIFQKYVNEWTTISYELFGGEDSTNAANYFATGLKGRYRESDGIYSDPRALEGIVSVDVAEGVQLVQKEIPIRRAMNYLLLEAYLKECTQIAAGWNKILEVRGLRERIVLPSLRFNRHRGMHAGKHYDVEGNPISAEEFEHRRPNWFPSDGDYAYVASCMGKVWTLGRIANWIVPPQKGVDNKSWDWEYVRFD
ncbi:MAG TPA: benzoyl-CoA 2,3-epoxidase subunit BoxB [Candidatus Nanoarchaeia archaeon]|nr:benzoyl-CoA 2,3-epoxidase subunit BoxB [Candidatus Nanoarchaeia archaeon]